MFNQEFSKQSFCIHNLNIQVIKFTLWNKQKRRNLLWCIHYYSIRTLRSLLFCCYMLSHIILTNRKMLTAYNMCMCLPLKIFLSQETFDCIIFFLILLGPLPLLNFYWRFIVINVHFRARPFSTWIQFS